MRRLDPRPRSRRRPSRWKTDCRWNAGEGHDIKRVAHGQGPPRASVPGVSTLKLLELSRAANLPNSRRNWSNPRPAAIIWRCDFNRISNQKDNVQPGAQTD